MQSLWTDTEELKTISGLTAVGRALYYCKHSESRYLADKHKRFRFSHSSNYCTKVPAYFMEALKNTGLKVYYESGEDRDVNYLKQHDDLV